MTDGAGVRLVSFCGEYRRAHKTAGALTKSSAMAQMKSSSGIGLVTKSLRQGAASILAQRDERCTRALSVAMPVLAYICR